MDIQIPDNWLREYLKTKAGVADIQKYLSLCGPSVERTEKIEGDWVYKIEITTNRIDQAGVYGIAQEAAAILPRFGIAAGLTKPKSKKLKLTNKVDYLSVSADADLCPRFLAVLIENVKIAPSPTPIQKRLLQAGLRPINNIVDISNYVMLALGQPVHTFDYDKIAKHKMILRQSKKGEKITTLDGKNYTLGGGDIVIEDGNGRLIDLAGIMGGDLSKVDNNTKNVLLFIQTYNPVKIRKTSMSLAARTDAATIFEKGLNPELVELALPFAINLFTKHTKGKPRPKVLDIYPKPYIQKTIKIDLDFINKMIGISFQKEEVAKILASLGFKTRSVHTQLECIIPSHRANDIHQPIDLVEEISRIYGYFNLPSKLPEGQVPDPEIQSPFDFEMKVKRLLKGFGAIELYTLSLVPKEWAGEKALKLSNALGSDTQYLKTTPIHSLIDAAIKNIAIEPKFHLFEMSHVYLAKTKDLPQEKMLLAGIFSGSSYIEAKGQIEALFDELHITGAKHESIDSDKYKSSTASRISISGKKIGEIGILEPSQMIYYELDMQLLQSGAKLIPTYKPIPTYPTQIEDITFNIPSRCRIGDLIQTILSTSGNVSKVELKDIYNESHTFRVEYQHPTKTLTDKEVEEIRQKIITVAEERFGAHVK